MKHTFSTFTAVVAIFYGISFTEATHLRRRAQDNVCSAFEIAEFDCYIDEPRDIVGVYVCRSGATTCVSPSATRSSDTCGCCAGDNRLACLDDGDGPEDSLVDTSTTTTVTTTVVTPSVVTTTVPMVTNATSTTVAFTNTGSNQICSAAQIMEFDCYIDELRDVTGVYVCRSGSTTCSLASNLQAGDTCGCCSGDTRLECLDDGDSTIDAGDVSDEASTTGAVISSGTTITASTTVTSSNGICSAAQMMEFDCDIRDDVVGVLVCRRGVTTCSLASDLQTGDNCGCCAGDNRLMCLDDANEGDFEGNDDVEDDVDEDAFESNVDDEENENVTPSLCSAGHYAVYNPGDRSWECRSTARSGNPDLVSP